MTIYPNRFMSCFMKNGLYLRSKKNSTKNFQQDSKGLLYKFYVLVIFVKSDQISWFSGELIESLKLIYRKI